MNRRWVHAMRTDTRSGVRVAQHVAECLGHEVVELLGLFRSQPRPVEALALDLELDQGVGLELVGHGEHDRLGVAHLELARAQVEDRAPDVAR